MTEWTRSVSETPKQQKAVSRRTALKSLAAGAATAVAAAYISPARAQPKELRVMMWENYFVPEIVAGFQDKHNARLVPTFFDGNSEVYNKLRVGGTRDFDLVQADGFWPSLYFREKLIRTIDYSKIPNTDQVFSVFKPDRFKLLTDEASGKHFGVTCCWGSYGTTYNTAEVPKEKAESIELLFDPTFAGRLSASARFEENIALTGILVATRMGTKDGPRPDGKTFNPYVLTDEELAEVEKLLIEQKKLLLTRYQDYGTLRQLMESGAVVAASEFAVNYRLLLQNRLRGESNLDVAHQLVPKEGGLGWVDTWLVTSGVTDPAVLDICYDFMNTFLDPQTNKTITLFAGASSTVDLRSISSSEEQQLYLMDRTEELLTMYQFDQPSSTEKWERVWSNMQAA